MEPSTWFAAGLAYLVPLAGALQLYRGRRHRRRRRLERVRAEAREAGLTESPSLHPAINPNRCLGCGACARACPEDALGVIAGKAQLVNPASCIGHGACRAACPFDAITLVLGSVERGVDVPVLGPDLQSNVAGLFVAGELGGPGLIRNSVLQGVRAIEAIRRLDGIGAGAGPDVVVVGAGPAGIAAALAARRHGLRAVTLEQEGLGGSLLHYPRRKLVMTSPVELPLGGRLRGGTIGKEELLAFWRETVRRGGVEIRERERVEAIERRAGGFQVRTAGAALRTRAVLLAIGRRGTPRKLGVPGEEQERVVYQLVDPEQYRAQRVLVVGGGDSALEASVALAEAGAARVTLSYRGAAFARARRESRAAVEAARSAGVLEVWLESEVLEIGPESVRLRWRGAPRELASDSVILCLGGVLPTELLQATGIRVETKRGTPLGGALPARRRKAGAWRGSRLAS
jgi:thioredoxin reductase/ferredoxin